MTKLVDYLISQKGIGSEFIDAWGKPATIKRENQLTLLRAMGYNIGDEESLSEQLQDEITDYWSSALDPVVVKRHDEAMDLLIRVPIHQAAQTHSIKLILEDGSASSYKITPVEGELRASQEIEGIEIHEYSVSLPACEQLGYHQLQLLFKRKIIARASFICAPRSCYIPQYIQQGKKVWGLSVQLYCIKSRRNWGMGDYTDLITLINKAAEKGADFIGLNPIHSLYPANPEVCSPYGPSSRQWLNYLYIDVECVPGFDTKPVLDWMETENIHARLAELRCTEYVDYIGVADLKLKALELAFGEFSRSNSNKNKTLKEQFKEFVKSGGESLKNLATFEALQMSLKNEGKEYWGWPAFPPELQSADGPEVHAFARKNKALVEFFLFLQWQSALQYNLASEAATESGMNIGLYRDLAVGVSEGGAEIWGNKSLYCTDVSVGAPPDILGPLGQKWGLPPMEPSRLVEQKYKPIIDLFASNMAGTGALRIDHVMALLRLWWVHKDLDACEGAYVNYPVDDLLAILALESVRNKSLVIGEDLGTVPDSIREKLHNNGMYSYRVFFFEQAEDGGFYSPAHYPVQSLATLTTHDMPTLIGFWHCDDLVLGKEVGLYPDQKVLSNLYDIRHENKQHILNTLHGHGSISSNISDDVHHVGMTTELNFGMQIHMASGSSALLSLQLEDWLQMDKPVNIPGTFNEYPNWKRKLSMDLEDIFNIPEVQTLTQTLSERRAKASTN